MKSPDLSFNGYIFLFLISKLKVSGGHSINRKVENITSHLYIPIENHFTFSSESIFSGDKQSSKYIRYRPPPSLPPSLYIVLYKRADTTVFGLPLLSSQ